MTDQPDYSEIALLVVEKWAKSIRTTFPGKIYIFGSVIYRDGEQFYHARSDIDLVAALLDTVSGPFDRAQVLQRLLPKKLALESMLVPELNRTSCTEAAVSIVPITSFEIRANVHKSGTRNFFSKNQYVAFPGRKSSIGLDGAGATIIPDANRHAVEYVQDIRNKYLAVAANKTGGLQPYSGDDPLPKSLMRAAAQLSEDAVELEWYDTVHGLEFLCDLLSGRRDENSKWKSLHRNVSIRRGGRGSTIPALTAYDQLLLSELLFEHAIKVATDKFIFWEIRLSANISRASEIVKAIQLLAPDAKLVDARSGSTILRLRSSKSSFENVKRLQLLGALSAVVECEVQELIEFSENVQSVSTYPDQRGDSTKLSKVAQFIERWGSQQNIEGKVAEHELAAYFEEMGPRDPDIATATRTSNALRRGREVDLLLTWPSSNSTVIVEISRIRDQLSFHHKVLRLLDLGEPVVFAVLASASLIAKLRGDMIRTSFLSGRLEIVPIQVT